MLNFLLLHTVNEIFNLFIAKNIFLDSKFKFSGLNTTKQLLIFQSDRFCVSPKILNLLNGLILRWGLIFFLIYRHRVILILKVCLILGNCLCIVYCPVGKSTFPEGLDFHLRVKFTLDEIPKKQFLYPRQYSPTTIDFFWFSIWGWGHNFNRNS